MLPNAYLLANFRFDTSENEPAKNLQNFEKFANFADPNPLTPELASSSARPQAAALRDLFQDALAHEDGEEDDVVRLREAQDALPPNAPAMRPA